MKTNCLCALVWLIASMSTVVAQNTAFTYQGKLIDGGTPANGTYDLQFKLFNALAGGNQIGASVIRDDVTVASGVFTVTLDFLATSFPGANRWLEIGVRPGVSTGAFTTLSPLQPITSTPYALQSLNAATATNFSGQLAGAVTGTQTATVLANNAVTTAKLADASVTDVKITAVAASKLTGTIPVASVPAGSSNYIQNTASLQGGSTFNITGNGFIGGTVGIGTSAPSPGNKLDVNGAALFRPGGSGGGFIGLHTPNGETGLTINGNGTTRADLRFDGTKLKLVASASGIPPETNGILIRTNGNVSIGTSGSFSLARLAVEAADGDDNAAVVANSDNGISFSGFSFSGVGVLGSSGLSGYAGDFGGRVRVTGVIEKAGGGFKIDHPLDPGNKYLIHSFVESPDMKNLYDGVVTTDANGEAEITLPDWFAALNRDFRYQLTCIGVFAQAIVAEEITDHHFKIRTSLPQVKVSWQVTGIRQDAWANQNRLPVEELKPPIERGFYQNPTAFGQPEERSIEWARRPEMMRRQKEERERRQREQNNKEAAPAATPNNR